MINKLHEIGFSADAILLNAGAYTHTSVAIGDAIKAIDSSVIEVHISNTFAREDFRHTSYITPVAKGSNYRVWTRFLSSSSGECKKTIFH